MKFLWNKRKRMGVGKNSLARSGLLEHKLRTRLKMMIEKWLPSQQRWGQAIYKKMGTGIFPRKSTR